ncbi:hypothetical protein CPHO_08470 [Corynebacterium phocae]|uniref:HNH endonuclease n=2 Tax=Corynebacterium phocae TaxID=161895 RepID=A0A1L7D6Y1_9CORY|nr:hypothetical protein CPHO_08470 [Corynebacterium phocae]
MPTQVYEAVMIRNEGRCEAGLKCCTGLAQEWHHRQRRQQGNDTIPNGAALCSACHRYITDHSPREGRDLGLIVHSHHPNPAEVPMSVRGRWVILTEDGSYEPAPEVV